MEIKNNMEKKKISKIRQLFLTETEKTFQYDSSRPSLPIPPLNQTLDRYLMWAAPHVSPQQLENTKRIVEEFSKKEGPLLNEKLLEYAKGKKNWMEDWWLKYAYLYTRDPLLPLTNTTGPQVLNNIIWPPSVTKALEYGSIFLWLTLEFFYLLRREKVTPQSSVQGKRLSMNQFRKVFNTCRIPKPGLDEIATWWKTESEGPCPDHMIILCNGHIWLLNPWDNKGLLLNAPELEEQLRFIRERSDKIGPGLGLSVLTCDNRDNWAKNRSWLASLSAQNSHNLELIESSIFVFVLDNSCPKDFQELCWHGLCGDTSNRWADKSLSGILTRNGYTAMNNDHSPYDAMVSVIMANFQYEVILEEMKGVWNGPSKIRDFPMPVLIKFDTDPSIDRAIQLAKASSKALNESVGVSFHKFNQYGKKFIKSQKLHPDAFVQLSLQLAYYRLHNKPAPTYETATTRQYYNARTETMRSCTPEAIHWVQQMLRKDVSDAECKKCLVTAANRHRELMLQCQDGNGIDRHLLGLYITALENNITIPDIFTDPTFSESGGGGNYILSTSTIGYTPIVGGVAAMCKDGYGVFYSILPDSISFFVSNFKDSKETSTSELCKYIDSSLADMSTVLTSTSSKL